MIKFKEHDGMLFKMLDKHVPLTPGAEMPCLIGTPVKEGSAEWALYQLTQGIFVRYDEGRPLRCDGDFIYCGEIPVSHIKDFLSKAAPTGWQLYKEPKLKYKVGDWVKYDIDSYLQVIEPSGKERTLCRTLSGVNVYPYTSCLTKASPADVVIHIGCLSGTIAKSCNPNYFLMLHSRPMTNCNHSVIRFSALDTPTRELVEGLLKAQNEEKLKGENND